jgi:hypothetical protein
MADTFVAITAGSGTNIDTFTEATNGNHRQCIVIGDPTATAGVAPVTAANGLDVDVTRIVPGTGPTNLGKAEDTGHVDGDTGVLILGVRNHSGSNADGDYSALSVSSTGDLHTISRRDTIRATASTTSSAATYTAGNQLGTLITLTSAARITGGAGVITGVRLIDSVGSIGAVDVVFFDSTLTLATDNTAFAVSDTDALKCIGLVQLAGSYSFTNNRLAQAFNLAVPYVCSGGTSLFVGLVARGGTTFATASTLSLAVTMDRY